MVSFFVLFFLFSFVFFFVFLCTFSARQMMLMLYGLTWESERTGKDEEGQARFRFMVGILDDEAIHAKAKA